MNETSQYLTFTLGGEEFALDISKVREVLDYTAITKMPKMPDYVKGVINLRGSGVPVVDLRMKLGMPETERTANSCIVIVEINLGGGLVPMGALTDTVEEVLDLDGKNIEPPPSMGSGIESSLIKGMGKKADKFIIILDIDRVLSGGETDLSFTEDIQAA
jgi:purine-binding chemotaxis protein CheW